MKTTKSKATAKKTSKAMDAAIRELRPSSHIAMVFAAIKAKPDHWQTHRDIHKAVPTISARTVRFHARSLAELGLLERHWIFPEYHYRIAPSPPVETGAYAKRLNDVIDMLSI